MGFLSSVGKLFGGGSEKQEISANEKAQAEVAGKRQQRYNETYLPLEMAAVEQYFDPSASKFKEAVVNRSLAADAAKAEAGALKSNLQAAAVSGTTLASATNNTGMTDAAIGASVAQGAGSTEAATIAQSLRDKEGIGLVRTGRDVSRATASGLSSLARQSNFSASSSLRDKMLVNRSKAKALGDIITSAAVGGYKAYGDAKSGLNSSDDLSPMAKLAREKFGVGAAERNSVESMSAFLESDVANQGYTGDLP